MPSRKKSVDDLLHAIRDLVNSTLLHYELSSSKDFNLLCSAMDTVGDCEAAIRGYRSRASRTKEELYLEVYGLLQVLFVQQDAVLSLNKVLGVASDPKSLPISLQKIREIRSLTIGHPTNKTFKKPSGKKETHNHNFLDRSSLQRGSYRLMSLGPGVRPRFKTVNLNQLLQVQEREITKLIRHLVRVLKVKVRDKQALWKDQALYRHLADSGYDLEKLSEDIAGRTRVRLGTTAAKSLERRCRAFGKDLKERKIMSQREIRERLQDLDATLTELSGYLRHTNEKSSRTAMILTKSLHNEVGELQSFAKEIDKAFGVQQPVTDIRVLNIDLSSIESLYE